MQRSQLPARLELLPEADSSALSSGRTHHLGRPPHPLPATLDLSFAQTYPQDLASVVSFAGDGVSALGCSAHSGHAAVTLEPTYVQFPAVCSVGGLTMVRLRSQATVSW